MKSDRTPHIAGDPQRQLDDECRCIYCRTAHRVTEPVTDIFSRREAAPNLTLVEMCPGKRYELGEEQLTIGRDAMGNSVVLPDDLGVSQHHSAIILANRQYWLQDLGSRQGTRLNGDYVLDREPLSRGDLIRIGRTVFVVE